MRIIYRSSRNDEWNSSPLYVYQRWELKYDLRNFYIKCIKSE